MHSFHICLTNLTSKSWKEIGKQAHLNAKTISTFLGVVWTIPPWAFGKFCRAQNTKMLNENASITNEREHVMHYCPKIMGITLLLSRTISIVVPSGHASCLLFVTNSFHYGVINFTLGPPNVMGFSAPTRLGMKISGPAQSCDKLIFP